LQTIRYFGISKPDFWSKPLYDDLKTTVSNVPRAFFRPRYFRCSGRFSGHSPLLLSPGGLNVSPWRSHRSANRVRQKRRLGWPSATHPPYSSLAQDNGVFPAFLGERHTILPIGKTRQNWRKIQGKTGENWDNSCLQIKKSV
jgi:hypothetical protein